MNTRGTGGHDVTVHIDGIPFYTFLEERFDAATERLWGAFSFIEPNFTMPSGRSFFEVAQQAGARGVDVKLLFWHNQNFPSHHLFNDTHEHRAMLRNHAPNVQARWDHSHPASHCHHQKAWLVDDVGMVGGMVMSHSTLANRAHDPPNKHDIFSSFKGPLLTELAEHFAMRWNHARSEDTDLFDAARSSDITEDATQPITLEHAGHAHVSLHRTIAPGLYEAYPQGCTEIWDAYREAIQRAKDFIYIENQHPGEEAILGDLLAALERGVEVLYIVPGEPMMAIAHERARYERVLQRKELPSRYTATFRTLGKLARFDNFTFAKLIANGHEIYVHAKICIIDDAWMTIGSANLVDLSMCADHTELNLTVYDDTSLILGTLDDLLDEHTGEHGRANGLRGASYVEAASAIARENAARRSRGERGFVGHLHALDAARYPL